MRRRAGRNRLARSNRPFWLVFRDRMFRRRAIMVIFILMLIAFAIWPLIVAINPVKLVLANGNVVGKLPNNATTGLNVENDNSLEGLIVKALSKNKTSEIRYANKCGDELSYLESQIAIAKVYLELVPIKQNTKFLDELRNQLLDIQNLVIRGKNDLDLPRNAHEKRVYMDETLSKAKKIIYDFEHNFRVLKDQFTVEKRSNEFLNQLLSKTIPKNLYCLSMKLSNDYYSSASMQNAQFPNKEKLEDPTLHHYVFFSDNVLAAAAVVNSTLYNSKYPENEVFHIVTDELAYAAMRMWFLTNPPRQATIEIQKAEDHTWLNSSYSPVLRMLESTTTLNYYFNTRGAKPDGQLKYRNPKYSSILNHLRFYLPQLFPKLEKVVFLDDDVVVQKDLSGLWDIDLKGNVNGAVETCVGKTFHRLKEYLNFSQPLIASNFDPNACAWAFGMNIFDLVQWRKHNLTETYHYWQERHNLERPLWKLGSLPPGLVTFYNRTLPIDRNWHMLKLGYDDKNLEQKDIENAAVIHYNGNKKPWLDIAILKYYKYWSKYIDFNHTYIRRCKILP